MITIDGSQGEGGGQILRTSLALSLVTGQPFRMERIRAKRQKPGLLKQHLTAVEAAKTVGCAEVAGAALSSQTLEFRPGPVTPGNYRFAVGTAGSATLVLQTVLPALLTASGHSTLTLEGGTHNPMAPPFDFLARMLHAPDPSHGAICGTGIDSAMAFSPQVADGSMPGSSLRRSCLGWILLERGSIRNRQARILVSKLPEHVAAEGAGSRSRRTEVACRRMWHRDRSNIPSDPGNAVVLAIEAEHVTEVFTGFGERGRPAEEVAKSAVEAAKAWLEAGVPVDEHLADQLLIPMALGRWWLIPDHEALPAHNHER